MPFDICKQTRGGEGHFVKCEFTFLFHLLLKIGECHILWQWILIIQHLFHKTILGISPGIIFAAKKTLGSKMLYRDISLSFKSSLYATINRNISHGHKTSIQLTSDEKCCSVIGFRGRISKACQWTSGVHFNRWKVFFSCPRVYKLNLHYYSCSWNYHINIVDRHINLFSDCMCLFFSFNCPTLEFKNNKINQHNTVNSTSQIGRHWSNITLRCFWPMSRNRSIFKKHFMPETFISINNNLQRKIRLLIIDRLSHDTVFWNLYF